VAQDIRYTWATQFAQKIVAWDYDKGTIVAQFADGSLISATSVSGKYVNDGKQFFLSESHTFWENFVDILMGIIPPAKLWPRDPHEQAHDDW